VDVSTVDQLSKIATDVTMNSENFESCIESERLNPLIERALEKATDDGVMGTLSFILGVQKIVGPQLFSNFRTLIDLQLDR